MTAQRRRWSAVVIAMLLSWAASCQAQTITEYPIPTTNSAPQAITLGPDGALWFIEEGCSQPIAVCSTNTAKIARITTAGQVTEFPSSMTPDFLAVITTGPDGALWYTDDGCSACDSAGSVKRMTTSGTVTTFSSPSSTGLAGITPGPDGAMWIVDGGSGNGNRIDQLTLSGSLHSFVVPNGNANFGGGIAIGSDGALWVAAGQGSSGNGPDKIIRITTSGAINGFAVPTSPAGLVSIAAGPDGALWFTEGFGNNIGRITTAGTITEYPLPTAKAYPFGIAAGSDGAMWFTESGCPPSGCLPNAPANIGRITTSGMITEYPLPARGSAPVGITAGPDGALWFTEEVTSKIGRITVPAGDSPLVAAVLPSSRSAVVGNAVTAFATIINSGRSGVTGCGIVPVAPVPAGFTFQTTDPTTNALTGSPNTPVAIAGANGSQSFVIALAANAAVTPTNVPLGFDCSSIDAAASNTGLNTLLFSASTTPVPDIVALAATSTNDGILHIPGASGSNAFAVVTVNVDAGAAITASVNTGVATLPLTISLCQTNPQTGQCLSAAGSTVSTQINAKATPTFAFFATATGAVPFVPQTNRIFVQFADQNGVVRGETSVAVETQ